MRRTTGGAAALVLLLAGCGSPTAVVNTPAGSIVNSSAGSSPGSSLGSSPRSSAPPAPSAPADAVSVQNGAFTITDKGAAAAGSKPVRQGVYICSGPTEKTNWIVTDLTGALRNFGKNNTAQVSRSQGTILILADCEGPWYKQGGGVNTGKVGTIAASGALQLPLSNTTGVDPCKGKGGYADVRPGAQVVFYDSAGVILANGQLDSGVPDGDQCTIPWTVVGIPIGKGPYQYEVSHRGKLVATEEQINSNSLDSTLGGN